MDAYKEWLMQNDHELKDGFAEQFEAMFEEFCKDVYSSELDSIVTAREREDQLL